MSDLINLFKKLTSVDSPSGDEKEISDFVFNYLKDLGLDPFQDLNNMIYCKIGEKPDKLFCAHLDTVEPGRGIEVIENEGYLVSKGNTILGGDNKVALATILQATKEMLSKDKSFELLFSVREETNSGIQEIDKSLLKSKVGFVFDYGNGPLYVLVKSAPSIIDFEIEIIGQSAHARDPEKSINVLYTFSEIINQANLGRPDKYSTLNIGLINAGDATNTIPGKIYLAGDLRSTKSENFETNKNDFEKVIRSAAKKTNTEVNIEWIPYSFGYELDMNSPNLKKVNQVYENILEFDSTTSGSDAGFLNHIGVETFCLGDGVENAHSSNERISIESLSKLHQKIKILMSKSFA